MANIGAPELVVFALIAALILIWPWWRIFSKAGYPGWYAFSQLVPILNLIALFYLAFARWPDHRSTQHDAAHT